jgi:GT2 family glycosyltransferase
MDLTIIIVNWNGGDALIGCLASIRRHTSRDSVGVIVVDNNSGDGSREAAQKAFPEFRVINSGANLGFGKANNLARQFVRTPLVLFLNPDTELSKGAIPAMISLMDRQPELGALGCKMRDSQGAVQVLPLQWQPSPLTQFLGLILVTEHMPQTLKKLLPYADPGTSQYLTKLYGGCIMARTSALDSIGWFDERYFMYAEDIDLCHSLHQKGWKLYYLSEAEIVHTGAGSSKKTRAEFPVLMRCESISKLMRKYHGSLGGGLYRAGVLIACQVRLAALMVFGVVAALFPKAGPADFARRWFKYKTMVLWGLKVRRPLIPGGGSLP